MAQVQAVFHVDDTTGQVMVDWGLTVRVITFDDPGQLRQIADALLKCAARAELIRAGIKNGSIVVNLGPLPLLLGDAGIDPT